MTEVFHYKILCQYHGTHFSGWQVQSQGERTIQGEINKVLAKMAKVDLRLVKTVGSGRTDAGVHALGQTFKASLPLKIDPNALMRGLNSLLNWEIRILSVETVDASFHPMGNSLWKEYIYLFTNGSTLSPFTYPLVASSDVLLDMDTLKLGVTKFKGEHDFKNYFCVGTETKTTVKNILEIELCNESPFKGMLGFEEENIWQLRIRGDGFLKQMVRLIVGSLWSLAKGKTTLDQIEASLSGVDTGKLGPVAPACGLYLNKVFYS